MGDQPSFKNEEEYIYVPNVDKDGRDFAPSKLRRTRSTQDRHGNDTGLENVYAQQQDTEIVPDAKHNRKGERVYDEKRVTYLSKTERPKENFLEKQRRKNSEMRSDDKVFFATVAPVFVAVYALYALTKIACAGKDLLEAAAVKANGNSNELANKKLNGAKKHLQGAVAPVVRLALPVADPVFKHTQNIASRVMHGISKGYERH